jgi:hypothetical protein
MGLEGDATELIRATHQRAFFSQASSPPCAPGTPGTPGTSGTPGSRNALALANFLNLNGWPGLKTRPPPNQMLTSVSSFLGLGVPGVPGVRVSYLFA